MEELFEKRTYDVELRVEDGVYGKKSPTISGYSAKFNILSKSMPIVDEGRQIGTFREKLLPGCFSNALPRSDVRMLINHDPNLILGRNLSGTLRMVEDEIGLGFANDPPETSYSKDIQVSIKRRDITQCSFAFRVAPGGDEYTKDPDIPNGYIRSIREISMLQDVSVVTYPAYDDTTCAVRSIVGKIQAEEAEVAKAVLQKEEEERQRVIDTKRKQLELAELSIVR